MRWWYTIRDAILGRGYRWVVKPIFFRFDPERVHNALVNTGARIGRTAVGRGLIRLGFFYHHPMLVTTIAGMKLSSPLGLAAGFDKEAVLSDIVPELGFGFITVGSITGTPGPGNPKPRLWRLPKSRGLVVHLGLNSSGAENVGARLLRHASRIPRGISIARANIPGTDAIEEGIADYVRAARALQQCGAYWEVNISCPNTTGGEPFTVPENLDRLLTALRPFLDPKPVFIKVPSNQSFDSYDQIIAIAQRHGVTGWVCTNLLKDRTNPNIVDADVPPRGGISGQPLRLTADDVIQHFYQATVGQMPIIGVGGVFTATDAYRKIRLGASAIQLITGMIYHGPSVVSEIQRGLVQLLQQDGFSHISEAVGVDAKLARP